MGWPDDVKAFISPTTTNAASSDTPLTADGTTTHEAGSDDEGDD